ncbi:MAG: flagellar basal body-associated FliL family protein [Clostridiales bacterium]|nr:flagellar basal body-associated FliL family protein [Clostridiales bacterium]
MNRVAIIAIIILLVLVIGIGSVLIFMLIPSKAENKDNMGYIYSTGESFFTNLNDVSHYVKADILIEVSDKEALEILEKNKHKIRDQIIEILGDIEKEEVKEANFKKNLRNILKEDLQNTLKIDKIKGIYFNEFIIQ